ncbi:MAG: hypothetical protein AAGB22_11575, partial [Bacteroidota bacterium]
PTTNTARSSKASPAEHPVDSETGNLAAKQSRQTKAYPDLGEFIPEDCTTTQDQPEYGNRPRTSEE